MCVAVGPRKVATAREYHNPEEIVGKLRQAEVLVGQDKPLAEVIRATGVMEPTLSLNPFALCAAIPTFARSTAKLGGTRA